MLAEELAQEPVVPDLIPDPTLDDRTVKAWRVSAKKSKTPIEIPVTKIGGKPTLLGSVTWPNCKRCNAPMMFAAQFVKDKVLALRKYEIVALFFCTDWDCEPYLPYSGANAVLLMSGAPSPVATIPAGPMTEYSVKLSTLRDKPDYEQASASFASKVGGFPRWVQNEGQHACECGLSMVTIAQIDANLDDALFPGDMGMWYVSVCATECGPHSGMAEWQ